jgi:hypothetical protein
MKVSSTLKNLYLLGNPLSDMYMKYLSELLELPNKSTLTELSLAHTNALRRDFSLTQPYIEIYTYFESA